MLKSKKTVTCHGKTYLNKLVCQMIVKQILVLLFYKIIVYQKLLLSSNWFNNSKNNYYIFASTFTLMSIVSSFRICQLTNYAYIKCKKSADVSRNTEVKIQVAICRRQMIDLIFFDKTVTAKKVKYHFFFKKQTVFFNMLNNFRVVIRKEFNRATTPDKLV